MLVTSNMEPLHEATKHLPEEVRNLIAGGLAGMMAKSVVAPLDRIKIMYQVSSAKFKLRNIPGVVRTIVEQEGLQALWRGNGATMLRVFPYAGIQFMVFDYCKSWVLKSSDTVGQGVQSTSLNKHGLMPVESLAAGSFAGVCSVLATYPLDLTRAQLAVLRKSEGGLKQGFAYVLGRNLRQRGIFGLYRGITPTLAGMIPYAGIAFTINEQGKKRITRVHNRDPTTIERMLIGGLAGLVGQSGTYPFEITRRRMQTIGIVSGSAAESVLHTNSLSNVKSPPSLTETIRSLYAEQGVRGFFKGLSMNWMKGPIAFSISFTSYDLIKGAMMSPQIARILIEEDSMDC